MADKVHGRDTLPLLLHSLCDRGAKLQPDNLIITRTATGYVQVTYAEHQIRTLRLASALSRWGVVVGDRVGTLLWNTAWHLQCYHAISCMGAVLHTLNLRLGPVDLGYIIDHAADRVIFSDHDLLALLGQVEQPILDRVELVVCCGEDGQPGAWTLPASINASKAVDYEAFLQGGTEDFVWPEMPETATHALCYTSGTTGKPKGAAYSHRSTYLHTIVGISGADQLALRGTNVVLPFVPMFHVLSWGVPFGALMVGCRIVFTGRFMDPDSVVSSMIDWGVDLSTGVPTVWQGVRAALEKRGLEQVRSTLNLKTLTCGGAAPPAELMAWYLEKLGVEFIQGWGMTEMNPLGTLGKFVAKASDLKKCPEERFANVVKAGLPLPGVEVRVADQEDLSKDMPLGQPGELLVKGPWIIQEYFQVDAPDKFHNGWLITGDIAKIDEEGAIVISDRSKDVIKSGGEWISSIDLENLITAADGVVQAAVVAVPHPKWDERPVAVVVLASGASSQGLVERIRDHCSSDFAKFQLPDDVLVWEALPLGPTGKIDKKAIRQRLADEGYTLPEFRGAEVARSRL